MNIRAKMVVSEVNQTSYSEKVTLGGVSSGNPEDNTYAKATPCASMTIVIDNPEAQGILKPGKFFYVDFTRVTRSRPRPRADSTQKSQRAFETEFQHEGRGAQA